MNTLDNVYCLGCKGRHETVEITQINVIMVRGSPRHQAKGVCPEGKTWTKLLKASEIPAEDSEEDNLIEEVSEVAPHSEEEVEMGGAKEVFKMAVEVAPLAESEVDEVIEPEVIEPEVIEPEVIEPEVIEPEVIEPEVIEPEVIEPEVIEPEVLEPEDIESVGEEEVIHTLRTHYPRPARKGSPRPRNISTPPVKDKEDIARAANIGYEIGQRVAAEEGLAFGEYMEDCWVDTRIPLLYREEFIEGYLAGGMHYIDYQEMNAQQGGNQSDNKMRPTTVAGIAGIGIFGAWLASKLTQQRR